MKRLAVIDLGTNTFNLLVVDKERDGFTEIFGTKVGVGLGLGGINDGIIREDAMQRGLETLHQYKGKCDELGVDKIAAFGTSAVRNASNKNDFIKRVKREIGLDVQVVDGKREAELIYKGVRLGLTLDHPFIIMDIGGGSTEFILGDKNQLIEAASFEIGAARIFQAFPFSDPLTPADCEQIIAYLEAGVGGFFDRVKVAHLVGASGSFETFYELLNNTGYPRNEYVTIPHADLLIQLERIIHSTKAERELDDRIIPIRKKMAPIVAVKIRWIIRKLSIENIIISPYSLKEGVINDVLY